MSTRRFLLALAAASGIACGSPAPPPRPAAATGKAPAKAAVDAKPAPEAAAVPDWTYSSVGKRDPFRSYLAEIIVETNTLGSRCSTPLGRYELEQFRLAAVVTGLEDPVAMVQAPNGKGYTIRRGTCIGKNGGVVAAIRSGEVIVTEWAVRADGTRDSTQTALRLPKRAELNLEE